MYNYKEHFLLHKVVKYLLNLARNLEQKVMFLPRDNNFISSLPNSRDFRNDERLKI